MREAAIVTVCYHVADIILSLIEVLYLGETRRSLKATANRVEIRRSIHAADGSLK
jgi:hypothetical protein